MLGRAWRWLADLAVPPGALTQPGRRRRARRRRLDVGDVCCGLVELDVSRRQARASARMLRQAGHRAAVRPHRPAIPARPRPLP